MAEKAKRLKITVITVCFNAVETIEKTFKSIWEQDYTGPIEHVVIDGGSTDGTLEIVIDYASKIAFFTSQGDGGIYDAMNKGLGSASGDVVMFLNADDYLATPSIFTKIADLMLIHDPDFIYGNVRMVGASGQLKRLWKADKSCETTVKKYQIPHPAFVVRKSVIDQCVPAFDNNMKIAADLKQQLILIDKLGHRGHYCDEIFVEMLMGGTSTSGLPAYIAGWKESVNAYNSVFGSGGFVFVFRKIALKLKQLPFFASTKGGSEPRIWR